MLWKLVRTLLNDCHSLLFGFNCGFDCLIHLAVTSAAAKIAAERAANLGFRRIRIIGEKKLDCHDETRRAKAKLSASQVAQCFQNTGKTPVLAHYSYGRDLLYF